MRHSGGEGERGGGGEKSGCVGVNEGVNEGVYDLIIEEFIVLIKLMQPMEQRKMSIVVSYDYG